MASEAQRGLMQVHRAPAGDQDASRGTSSPADQFAHLSCSTRPCHLSLLGGMSWILYQSSSSAACFTNSHGSFVETDGESVALHVAEKRCHGGDHIRLSDWYIYIIPHVHTHICMASLLTCFTAGSQNCKRVNGLHVVSYVSTYMCVAGY